MPKYPVAEKLIDNAAVHCTTIAITQNVITGAEWPTMAQPNAALRNGTLTFVKSGGCTYGITCNHVVQHYREVLEASSQEFSHSMRTMLNGFYHVQDRFIQPSVQLGDDPLDISIREINPDHVAHIGKEAMDLDVMSDAPEDLQHAYAVGFPETMKYHKHDDRQHYRVVLPQVEILAELPCRPGNRFTLFSEIEKPAEEIDCSGMSGGPIYWSSENDFGILGIIYEGGLSEDNQSIYVYGEFATPDVIRGWIEQCPPIYDGTNTQG